MNFQVKSFLFLGGGGWGGEGCFAHKSIYWLDFEILIIFALSNLTIAVKFLTERKRRKFSFKILNTLVALYMCIRVPLIVSHRGLPT